MVLATLSKPSSPTTTDVDPWKYTIGVGMLATSLVLTGALGVMQEITYKRYGPCWKEGVFYTVGRPAILVRILITTPHLASPLNTRVSTTDT